MITQPKELLIDWLLRIRRIQLAHAKSATYFERLNFWLGIPVVALTTLVGTSVFATLQKEAGTSIKIAVGIASVLAAILAGLQTFLRYSERAERHRVTGAKYGVLRREIEQKLALPSTTIEEIEKYVDSMRMRWDKLSEDSPMTPQRIWDGVDQEIKKIKQELILDVGRSKGAA
jgi:hypothetical protein